MLRINKTDNSRSTLLTLEGALREPWVAEFQQVITESQASKLPLKLDLSDVTYIDQAGIALLRGIIDRGAKLVACSDFVAASLGLEKP